MNFKNAYLCFLKYKLKISNKILDPIIRHFLLNDTLHQLRKASCMLQ